MDKVVLAPTSTAWHLTVVPRDGRFRLTRHFHAWASAPRTTAQERLHQEDEQDSEGKSLPSKQPKPQSHSVRHSGSYFSISYPPRAIG